MAAEFLSIPPAGSEIVSLGTKIDAMCGWRGVVATHLQDLRSRGVLN